ncbi:putative Endonuclease-reverse transcriptase [Trypanosoma cruzi]|nr:putative Endonuclease-reverse transcriptase [Trypanosoma cruzi]
MVKAFDCVSWSASVSPLSDHYMLTFTLHQHLRIPYLRHPLRHLRHSTVGEVQWDLFIRDFDAQLPAYDYKKQSTGIKAFTRALITSYRRHCPRGMHKDGPRLWDDTLMEAERIATDSKARYLQLPTPDRERRNATDKESILPPTSRALAQHVSTSHQQVKSRRTTRVEIHFRTKKGITSTSYIIVVGRWSTHL